jgi:short-subunit dehydrogenase
VTCLCVALVSDVFVQCTSRNDSASSNEQVTGSSGGIGKEIAREMHLRGCDVIISGRDMARSYLCLKKQSS